MRGMQKVVFAPVFVLLFTMKGSKMDFIDKKIEAMFGKNEAKSTTRYRYYENKFFEMAHQHFFGCTPDLRIEIAQYHRGVISHTMMRYVCHLKAKEIEQEELINNLREEPAYESKACKASCGLCSGACMYCLQQAN